MENGKVPAPHYLLNKALIRKKERFSFYSQRALARDLGVSSAFVTKILSGKRAIPPKRIRRICRVLDMDPTAETILLKSIVLHSQRSNDLKQIVLESPKLKTKLLDFKNIEHRKFSLLSNWYNLAILYLLTCKIDKSTNTIAKKLGLSASEVERSLNSLKNAELVACDNGQWKKTTENEFFPTTKSLSEVRGFHRQMIKKSYDELSKTSQESFDSRLITGFTIATNPEKIDVAKKLVFEILGEISTLLSDGTCTEVYQCNVQLFPLTKKENNT